LAIELPVNITFKNDKSSLKKAEKEASKPVRKGMSGAGIAAAGLGIVGLVGGLLSSLDSIGGLLKGVLGLLNALVAPFVPILLTLLKPFLALFLFVGSLLAKYLKSIMSGPVGEAVGTGVEVAGEAGSALGDFIGNLFSMLNDSVNSIESETGAKFSELVSGMFAIFRGSLNGTESLISKGTEQTARFFNQLIARGIFDLLRAFGNFKLKFMNFIDTLVLGLASAFNGIVNKINSFLTLAGIENISAGINTGPIERRISERNAIARGEISSSILPRDNPITNITLNVQGSILENTLVDKIADSITEKQRQFGGF